MRAVVNQLAIDSATTIVQMFTVPMIASVMIANGQVRQPVERVEEAHHRVVELAADEARDRAVDDADHEDRERRREADPDRDLAARATRAKRSRPNLSVPNGCSRLGGRRTSARSRPSFGSMSMSVVQIPGMIQKPGIRRQ